MSTSIPIILAMLTIIDLRKHNDQSCDQKRVERASMIIVAAGVFSYLKSQENLCENFYEYCTGNDADRTRVNRAKLVKDGLVRITLRGIARRFINKIEDSEECCSSELQIASLYESCMNTTGDYDLKSCHLSN